MTPDKNQLKRHIRKSDLTAMEKRYLEGLVDGTRWIPCSERMPPTGTKVYVREGSFTVIGFFGRYTQKWIAPISGAPLDNVTHWMPLPEPPEEREEDEENE